MSGKLRRAMFTINNYSDNWVEMFDNYYKKGNVAYLCAGAEKAPTTGTPHLQCYISWKKPTMFAKLAKCWKTRFEMVYGSDMDNKLYCSKTRPQDTNPNELFMEWGEIKCDPKECGYLGGEIEAKRWDDARNSAKEGKMDEIPSDIYIRYCKSLEWIRAQNELRPADLDGSLQHLWIHGAPGVGKSRLARMIGSNNYFTKNLNKWWDGYKGEPFVVLDEVSTKNRDWIGDFLKIWADRYAFNAETKGSTKLIRPPCLIVTSNYTIQDLWPKTVDEALSLALQRRFNEIEMLKFGLFGWTANNLETYASEVSNKYCLDQYRIKIQNVPGELQCIEELPELERQDASDDILDSFLNLDPL